MHVSIETRRESRIKKWSLHARLRAQQRNLSQSAITYVCTYGRLIRRTGIRFYFLAMRDVPKQDRHLAWVRSLVGTTLLVSADGETLITLYKNPRAIKKIKRKLKYRLLRPREAQLF